MTKMIMMKTLMMMMKVIMVLIVRMMAVKSCDEDFDDY